eukprot:CAMPEP_0184700328 /NCGR_PEP_ID=MMETSP0313-20130426/12147_1 /TAXON_ID=2792 /ORGANISM="Porphyridium aerugineum, Strain SAG 1380-2" /LENGTH=334 /DNA_ID=CAMNT_0027159939 /DNA_START=32 /DNA_END=1036 /DNA_ORIENTATION=+
MERCGQNVSFVMPYSLSLYPKRTCHYIDESCQPHVIRPLGRKSRIRMTASDREFMNDALDRNSSENDKWMLLKSTTSKPNTEVETTTTTTFSFFDKKLDSLRFGYEIAELDRIKYQCPKGHIVEALKSGDAAKICPKCKLLDIIPELNTSRRRGSMRGLCQLAKSRKGELLLAKIQGASDNLSVIREATSDETVLTCTELESYYRGVQAKYWWRCEFGHEWQASAHNVKKGSWCPFCDKNKPSKKLTISDMQIMAQTLGGECLSTEYNGSRVKLLWRCKNGHEFMMAPNNIRRTPIRFPSARKGAERKYVRLPSWCPVCKAREKAPKMEDDENH